MPLNPDQSLLHYRLIERIGEGGMGEVYADEDVLALLRDGEGHGSVDRLNRS